MSTEKDSIQFAELPLATVLPDTRQVDVAIALLEELDAVQQLIDGNTLREKELKLQLAGLQKVAGTKGLRWGQLCFVARKMPGRATLNKEKLMTEAGVTADQLAACTTTGAGYDQLEFRNLTRKRRQGD